MAEYSQKWHNGTSSKARSTETSNGLAAIQAQLKNLGREIKKVNEKVYATLVGCELCKGPHYTKDYPLKEEGKTLEEAYYIQFGAPYQPEGYKETRRELKHDQGDLSFYRCSYKKSRASIKTLEIQIGQISKVLQERGIGGLPVSTEPNLRDHVKSISTAKADSSKIFRMRCSPYVAQVVKILEAYDRTLPLKEKDPWSFTLPCFIHNVCFDKAIVDLGPRGVAKNVLVRIGKFIFPIDFIILDISEDDDVPLILSRPFLSTAHSKIDVYKRKFTIRVREEKLVFKSIKTTTSIIRRVFMLKDLDSKTKLIREDDESFDPLYGNYIELNDLDSPLELATNQDVNFDPTFVNKHDNGKTSFEYCYK
nr:hypothetical protein [Tanacetum cinerariifolium]